MNKWEKELDKAKHIRYNGGRKGAARRPVQKFPRQEVADMRYVCNVCGWVYDEEEQGVKWEDLPDDFACELCGVGKDDFSPEE